MAEALVIALAVATLTSGFGSAVDLVARLKATWRERRASRAKLAELEKLEQALVVAQSTIHNAYQTPYRRYGQHSRSGMAGIDLARHILFALAAQQDGLLGYLQHMDVEHANIQPVIARIEGTRITATGCLNDLATRTQRPHPPPQLTLQDHASLQMEHQNLCHSAVLYRTGQATHDQLAVVSSNQGKSSCQQCRAVLIPSKMQIPGADRSSCVAIDLSGLFRAHCHIGNALTCIWQLRRPSCYGVFRNEKALLRHLLDVHVRSSENGADIEVDWPADIRRGNIQKCGFSVRINALQMRNQNGSLVIPMQRVTAVAMGVSTAGPNPSTVDVGYSDSTSEWSSVIDMDPSEVRERYEMPSTERFEMCA
ncbi:MAG: hypothetical protein M1840_006714 [Geoglossum simile]|nr:MAG: hypothetical protein M1840_006714 [Geoglossum simile]